ncbi:hypothetical protein [Rathayibacter sp. AY1A7]|uniref:hypothetical protein n=1 Tax=Rathayibacter sp. AY1A7 TaxID=2080524 RepID=UPI000CE92B17|nr:hypothetical protein [Rathayibacter sp. AY1A7]PPF18312.1 hypothetical protein C5B95_11955 [Rathayibacter sp. AY1A7]
MFVTTGFLSKDVKTPGSSIGAFLRERFPQTRALQVEHKARAGKLLVPSADTASSSTVGAGIDLVYRLLLDPDDIPSALTRLFPFNDAYQAAIATLCHCVSFEKDREYQARAAWALGLTVNSYRAGPLQAPRIFEMVKRGMYTFPYLMAEAPEPAVRELTKLRSWGEKRLLPKLHRPLQLGPTFDLSTPGDEQRIAAEADLIADGLLLDIKTTLGQKASDGMYYDALKADQLYQLIGYALMDHSNAYAIRDVGIYSARYGTLTTWPLQQLLDSTAGRLLVVQDVREELWALMHQEHQFL